jgi:hypothetical protein
MESSETTLKNQRNRPSSSTPSFSVIGALSGLVKNDGSFSAAFKIGIRVRLSIALNISHNPHHNLSKGRSVHALTLRLLGLASNVFIGAAGLSGLECV